MSTWIGALQGSYAYLLIFQIIVVTMLLLTLLWLIGRRLRETGIPELLPQAGTDEGLANLSREQTSKIQALEAQVSEMEKGGALLIPLKEKNKALQDKVKYLEQKLLEYEILQEEIGQLSNLKVENEKLKEQLMGGGPKKADAPAAPPTAFPVQLDAPSGLTPFEDRPEDKPTKGADLAQNDIDGLISKIESLSSTKKP